MYFYGNIRYQLEARSPVSVLRLVAWLSSNWEKLRKREDHFITFFWGKTLKLILIFFSQHLTSLDEIVQMQKNSTANIGVLVVSEREETLGILKTRRFTLSRRTLEAGLRL